MDTMLVPNGVRYRGVPLKVACQIVAVVGYLDGSSDDDCMGEQIINLCSWVTAYIGHMYMDGLSESAT